MRNSCKVTSLRLLRLGLLAAALAVAACEPYKVVATGAQSIGPDMTVSKTKAWVQILPPHAPKGPDQVWTLDGLGLNALMIYGGVKDGQTLLKVQGEKKEQPPAFTSGMDGLELQELVGATISRALAGGVAVEPLSLTPATFMGAPGFATEFAFPNTDGLDMRGYAEGANIDGKLYLLLFVAPRIHYYAKDLEEVRAIAHSAIGTGAGV